MMNLHFKTESRTINVQNIFWGENIPVCLCGKNNIILALQTYFFYVVLVSEGSCDTEDWSKDW